MKLIPFRDVILVKKPKTFWGKITKFFLKSEYSHSEYVIDDWHTFGTDLRNPACIHNFGYNMADIEIWRYKWDISDKQKDLLTEFIQKSTKTKYDWLEALCLGLGLKYRGKDSNYVCISLILKAMEYAGLLPINTYKNYNDFSVFTNGLYFTKMS